MRQYIEIVDLAHQAIVLLSGRLIDNKIEQDNFKIEFQEFAIYLENKYGLKVESPSYLIRRGDVEITLTGLTQRSWRSPEA